MSKKLAFALVLVGLAAACAPQPQPIPDNQAVIITPEPVFQGKFGAN